MDTSLLLALGALGLYFVACVWWPYTNCRRCSGTGKRRSPTGKAWRPCGRCDGSGRRIRFGRVLWEIARGNVEK